MGKMNLKVVGAGLPRTGTASLKAALERLLGGPCYHMREIEGHPFDLGRGWQRALSGDAVNWDQLLGGYVAAVDWPASMFWRQLSEANPGALVILSVRDSTEVWWRSFNEMVLPHARRSLAPQWTQGRDLASLLEQFVGAEQWDHPDALLEAYIRHNAAVRKNIPQNRLLEWRATEGWEPICRRLGLSVPDEPFPWIDGRNTGVQ